MSPDLRHATNLLRALAEAEAQGMQPSSIELATQIGITGDECADLARDLRAQGRVDGYTQGDWNHWSSVRLL
jgi:hypothetical protein